MKLLRVGVLAILALPGLGQQNVGEGLRQLREGQKKAESAAIDRAAEALAQLNYRVPNMRVVHD